MLKLNKNMSIKCSHMAIVHTAECICCVWTIEKPNEVCNPGTTTKEIRPSLLFSQAD